MTAPTGRVSDRVSRAAAWVGAWALVVALFTVHERYAVRWFGSTRGWSSLLLRQSVSWLAWAALLPLVARAARRVPLRRGTLGRGLAAHAAVGAATAVLHSLLVAAVYPLFYYAPSAAALRDVFRERVAAAFAVNLLVYIALVAALQARRHAVGRAELEARSARAELGLLTAQLQPHFLFNALNSAVALIETDPPTAARMVRSLSDLLRRSLAGLRAGETTLDDELATLERYVAVQRVRFPTLAVTLDADAAARGALVPPLILQPLVENAIKFSVGARGEGVVRVEAVVAGDALRVSVSDDGVGFGAGAEQAGAGLGLPNVRARLASRYGDAHALACLPNEPRGARVVLTLPRAARPA